MSVDCLKKYGIFSTMYRFWAEGMMRIWRWLALAFDGDTSGLIRSRATNWANFFATFLRRSQYSSTDIWWINWVWFWEPEIVKFQNCNSQILLMFNVKYFFLLNSKFIPRVLVKRTDHNFVFGKYGGEKPPGSGPRLWWSFVRKWYGSLRQV